MQKKEISFRSADGIQRIHAVEWLPEGEPKAILQIVHGMAEYVERYEDFATFMTEHGYIVVGEDHLGHGKSVGENGKRGFFCEGDAASIVVRDVHRLHEEIVGEYPTLPCFILGHSMGSFITRNYLTEYGFEVQGAVIMSTGMQPRLLLRCSKLFAKLRVRFVATSMRVRYLITLSLEATVRRYPSIRQALNGLHAMRKLLQNT